jgi:hypothetical protein
MTTTWSHLCNTNNSFSTLQLTQECKACGIDHRVQAMRWHGYQPSINKTVSTSLKTRIAALLKPNKLTLTIDEHQSSYYDRQG